MADRVRIVEFSDRRKRPVTILDLNDLATTFNTREGGFSYTPPAKNALMASDDQRFGGERQVGEGHGNGQVSFTTGTKGASGDACLANLEAALATLNAAATVGRYVEWRPEGATYSSFFLIQATAAWNPAYKVRQFAGSFMIDTQVAIPTAPLVEWDAMDIYDDFSVDSIGDYAFDLGAGTLSVTGGQLVPSSTAVKRLYHTARGYTYADAQVTLKYTTGATIAGIRAGVIVKRIDASNFLYATLEDSGGGAYRLRLWKTAAGVATVLASLALTTAFAANTTYWLRGRIEGNTFTGEHWVNESLADTTTSYTLTGGEVALFGSAVKGNPGLIVTPPSTDYSYDDFRVEPFTRTTRALPEQIDFPDLIPGTAPALVDLYASTTAGQQPVFAAFGWGEKPASFSPVWNGDFEDSAMGTAGWATSGLAFNNPVTSVSRNTAFSKFGVACMQVNSPATGTTGPGFKIYRPFKKGVRYTVEVWVRGPDAVQTFGVAFGTSGDVVTSASATANPALGFTKFTVTWTPTADAAWAAVEPRLNTAVVTAWHIDGVIVYETALGPPTGKQGEGRGAVPPFGVIECESLDTSTAVNMALTASAQRGGFDARGTYNAAGNRLELLVDPSLIARDDFRAREVDVEVWLRFNNDIANLNQRAIVSLLPEEGTTYGVERFTNEWGAAGRPLTAASAGNMRLTRAGTLTMPVDPANPRRYRLRIAFTAGAGSTGLTVADQVILLPARARMASPTGKANDTTYPKVAPSSSETRRVFLSDGRGLIGAPGGSPGPYPGLDGARCMPDPGPLSLVALFSSTVPDDPTVDASGDLTASTAASIHAGVVPRSYLARGA